ncbi:hypothetical protein HS088_TW17G00493 [Tripterygium wilfordii]|uniref:Uncharacterized protein n=1 Tax=Tripterygium wilfordii TaxID=458696 RepID=A0A7J7CFT5_TRIWF|nr:uncharacterized protein LOC119983011 [Tripterygium wilfordii]KAF5732960.1 hypothetical protein HS088_TW17G00493 [Tripterygium wilfordii]
MNPQKIEDNLYLDHDQHGLGPPLVRQIIQSQPSIQDNNPSDPDPDPSFSSLPEIVVFRSSSSDSPSRSSDDNDESQSHPNHPDLMADYDPSSNCNSDVNPHPPAYISPEPHISSQFYTFNAESHSLMIRCILEGRLATPAEIRAATPRSVLKSWRSVWKDRNEDTAYLTAWKRIQEKLTAHVDAESGNEFLCFKNHSQQFVSHTNQWQDIVMSFHCDADLKHLGLKETIERVKQVWTVGAKFYGIPESYIRVCVASCPVCSASSGSSSRSKRRRFEYTESFDVPAKEVPNRLQQLAAKHKVVLCIRQKYIRYKPFMAEVKDYACHRAGEPAAKKSKILKREPYVSKRCGCGFRIRAILPISNYNEKEKTFVYQEDGMAVFKLYAVHSGHEPGPLDGNARIMHRVVGHKGEFMIDQEMVYGVREDGDNDGFGYLGKDDGDLQFSILRQLHDLRTEIGSLEGRIGKIPHELLGSVSRDLFDVVNKVRSLGEDGSKSAGLLSDKPHPDDVLVGANALVHWSDQHHDKIYMDGKEAELIEDNEDSFGRSLGDVVPWEQMRADCRSQKDLIGESCKPEKWFKCSDFDEKSILECEDTKLTKPLRHDEAIVSDVGLVGGIQVDSFYQENPKWYESPCGLDTNEECGDGAYRHEEIV